MQSNYTPIKIFKVFKHMGADPLSNSDPNLKKTKWRESDKQREVSYDIAYM